MALESHYDVLGVVRSADGEIIRAAYRVLAKRYHPDVAVGVKDKAAARFCRIHEAYEVLSDARRRAEYDAQLDAVARELQTAAVSPMPNPGTAAASIYWRGVGYLLIILGLGGVIEIIGVWVIGMIGGLEAPRSLLPGKQPLSPGTVLRFDNKGNLIQIAHGTSLASPAIEERDSWRHEWWCAQPAVEVNEWLNYNDQHQCRVLKNVGRKRRSNATTSGVNGASTIQRARGKPIKIRAWLSVTTGGASGAPDTRPTDRGTIPPHNHCRYS